MLEIKAEIMTFEQYEIQSISLIICYLNFQPYILFGIIILKFQRGICCILICNCYVIMILTKWRKLHCGISK